jgi:hypothetical protein
VLASAGLDAFVVGPVITSSSVTRSLPDAVVLVFLRLAIKFLMFTLFFSGGHLTSSSPLYRGVWLASQQQRNGRVAVVRLYNPDFGPQSTI